MKNEEEIRSVVGELPEELYGVRNQLKNSAISILKNEEINKAGFIRSLKFLVKLIKYFYLRNIDIGGPKIILYSSNRTINFIWQTDRYIVSIGYRYEESVSDDVIALIANNSPSSKGNGNKENVIKGTKLNPDDFFGYQISELHSFLIKN